MKPKVTRLITVNSRVVMFGFGKYHLKVLSRLTVAGTLVSTAQAELQLDYCSSDGNFAERVRI